MSDDDVVVPMAKLEMSALRVSSAAFARRRDQDACAVCLNPHAAGGDPHCILLPCGHVFHDRCAREWFRTTQTCPTCRASIMPPRRRSNADGRQ